MQSTPPDFHKLAEALERIYQIVVGLAITEAVKRFIRETKPQRPEEGAKREADTVNETDVYFSPHKESIPEAIAFFFTAVSFFHGMSRYIELTYGNGKPPSGILLFDIIVFLLEGCIMFMLASALTANRLRFFEVLIALFVLDTIWCAASIIFINFSKTLLTWIGENLLCIAVLWPICYWLFPKQGWWATPVTRWKWSRASIICSFTIITKVVVDCCWNWKDFYFWPGHENMLVS
jgi:hypothetical protein